MSRGTPRQRKPAALFEIGDGSMGVDKGDDPKYSSQAPLVSEVTRRYKVRAPPARSQAAGLLRVRASI